jgi:predicted XRE-type DNA-binding protein
MNDQTRITRSSSNVFADLGLPNPEEALAKAKLARRIAAILAERGWSQSRAAEEMGIDQPKLSDITRGKLAGYSVERLVGYLNKLGEDVEIRTRPNPQPARPARMVVHAFGEDEVAAAPSSEETMRFE